VIEVQKCYSQSALDLICLVSMYVEEIIVRYIFTMAQSRDLNGFNLTDDRYRESKNLLDVNDPIKSGLV